MLARVLTAGAVSTVLLSGCVHGPDAVSSEQQVEQERRIASLLEGKPRQLEWQYRALVLDGPRNAVLNNLEIGHRAMALGHPDLAASAFDDALTGITAVYADDPAAEKARSVWHSEEVKDFKGEPYERAMAFVYRGILDMLDGDYENARAAFKGALIQDSFAELERHRQDFASAAWLVGWTSKCLGDEVAAAEAFAEAAGIRRELASPREEDRFLVLVEAGRGPTKITHGEHDEKIAYRQLPGPRASYAIAWGDELRPAVLAEDLFHQATTRGGRQMDDLLAEKVLTKVATRAAGQGATAAGVGMMAYGGGTDDSRVAAAGAVIGLIGLIAQAAAESMTAQADARYWQHLPHSLYVAPLPMPEQAEDVRVVFADDRAPATSGEARPLTAVHGNCGLAWYPFSQVRLAPPQPIEVKAERGPVSTDRAIEAAPRGNCRTKHGSVRNIRPDVCAALGGTVLSHGAAM